MDTAFDCVNIGKWACLNVYLYRSVVCAFWLCKKKKGNPSFKQCTKCVHQHAVTVTSTCIEKQSVCSSANSAEDSHSPFPWLLSTIMLKPLKLPLAFISVKMTMHAHIIGNRKEEEDQRRTMLKCPNRELGKLNLKKVCTTRQNDDGNSIKGRSCSHEYFMFME